MSIFCEKITFSQSFSKTSPQVTVSMARKIANTCLNDYARMGFFAQANDIQSFKDTKDYLHNIDKHLNYAKQFIIRLYETYYYQSSYLELSDYFGFTDYEIDIAEAIYNYDCSQKKIKKENEENLKMLEVEKKRENEILSVRQKVKNDDIFSMSFLRSIGNGYEDYYAWFYKKEYDNLPENAKRRKEEDEFKAKMDELVKKMEGNGNIVEQEEKETLCKFCGYLPSLNLYKDVDFLFNKTEEFSKTYNLICTKDGRLKIKDSADLKSLSENELSIYQYLTERSMCIPAVVVMEDLKEKDIESYCVDSYVDLQIEEHFKQAPLYCIYNNELYTSNLHYKSSHNLNINDDYKNMILNTLPQEQRNLIHPNTINLIVSKNKDQWSFVKIDNEIKRYNTDELLPIIENEINQSAFLHKKKKGMYEIQITIFEHTLNYKFPMINNNNCMNVIEYLSKEYQSWYKHILSNTNNIPSEKPLYIEYKIDDDQLDCTILENDYQRIFLNYVVELSSIKAIPNSPISK